MLHRADVVVGHEVYPPEHPLRRAGRATGCVLLEPRTPLGRFYLRALGLRPSGDGRVRVAVVHPVLTRDYVTRWLRSAAGGVDVRIVAAARRSVA
jgi:hypothetical protein